MVYLFNMPTYTQDTSTCLRYRVRLDRGGIENSTQGVGRRRWHSGRGQSRQREAAYMACGARCSDCTFQARCLLYCMGPLLPVMQCRSRGPHEAQAVNQVKKVAESLSVPTHAIGPSQPKQRALHCLRWLL